MFKVLRPFLNKGGAGFYATRDETSARLRPVVERHVRLLGAYDRVLPHLQDGEAAARLRTLLPFARTELAKLNETLYSTGYRTGVTVAPETAPAAGSDYERLHALLEAERAHGEATTAETDAVHHQERTRAILGVVARGSQARLDLLRELTARLRRPSAT